MVKVGLYAHGGSGNHGCEALVRSTIKFLGNQEYILFSEKPDDDLHYHLDEVACIMPSQNNIPQGLAYFLYATLFKISKNENVYYHYLYRQFREKSKNIDIAFAIGGDNYCYNGFTERFAVLNKALARNGIPTVLWGCSIDSERINRILLDDLHRYKYITARESITYETLKRLGFNNVKFMPDTAFLLDSKEVTLPDGFIPDNSVGLNISPLIIKHEHTAGIIIRGCRQLIQYILDNTDMSIILLPHVVWQENNDLEPLTELYRYYSHTGRVVMIDDDDAMTLKGYIKRCRFLIAARTHVAIAGYSSAVPTLTLGYSVKSKGIATDLFGTSDNYVLPVYDIIDVNQLTNSFMWLMGHEKAIRLHYQVCLPEYKKKLSVIKEWLMSFLL